MSDNQYYHCGEKECNTEIFKTNKEGKISQTFDYATCHTHNVKICRCGWQMGMHFGTKSKDLKRMLLFHNDIK